MKLMKTRSFFLQLVFIVVMSAAASYAFQRTQLAFQINGLCFYRYFVYSVTVFLGYVSFSRYNKFVALAFSVGLSIMAFSPVGLKAIELFPLFAPFLAVLMGVTTVLVVPRSRGRGFFEFVVVLILPAVLVESRIAGSLRLLATTESVGYFELSLITLSVVGGYFYLRYAALSNLSCLELLSNGGNERDVVRVSMWSNLLLLLVVIVASGTAMVLMNTTLIVADAFRSTFVALPLYVIILAMGAGITMTTILYIIKHSLKESQLRKAIDIR